MFNTNNKGFGFGAMPGFNGRKIGTISNGDYDRDGVKNKKDCDAFNFRKQGPEHEKNWNEDKLSEKQAKLLANNLGLSAYKKLNGYWAVE